MGCWSAKSEPIWWIAISPVWGRPKRPMPRRWVVGGWRWDRRASRHDRVVAIAQEHQVVKGRKMRLDTTVVETNIHYPTDSNLLGDGVRVLIRAMKRITEIAGQQGAKLRDRSRS